MALKLTFEAEMKGAQDVERYLTEWSKKLNEAGQAGEKMSEYVNSGLKTMAENLEGITKAQGGISSLSKQLEGLGTSVEKGFGAAKNILIDKMKEGIADLERQMKGVSQNLASEMEKLEQAKDRGDKKAEERSKSAVVRHASELSTLGRQREQFQSRLGDPIRGTQAGGAAGGAFGLLNADDKGVLNQLVQALKGVRSPVDMLGFMGRAGDIMAPPQIDPETGAPLPPSTARRVAGASGRIAGGLLNAGVFAVAAPQMISEVGVEAPLRAYVRERQRTMAIGQEAAQGDITTLGLRTLGRGALAEWERGDFNMVTAAADARIAGKVAGHTVGAGAMMMGGAGLLAAGLLAPVTFGASLAIAGAGAGLAFGGMSLYKSPDEIWEEEKDRLRDFDKKKYGLAFKSAGKYWTQRGAALGGIQTAYGKTKTNEVYERFLKDNNIPLEMAAELSKAFLPHGALPGEGDLSLMFGKEMYGMTEGYQDLGVRLKMRAANAPGRRTTFGFAERVTPTLLAEAGLGEAGSFAARQDLFNMMTQEANQHFIQNNQDFMTVSGRLTTAVGAVEAGAMTVAGQRLSEREAVRAGGVISQIGKQLETTPATELNLRLNRLLMEEGITNPFTRDFLINMDLRRPETVKQVLAQRDGRKIGEISDEEVKAFQTRYQSERTKTIEKSSERLGFDPTNPLHKAARLRTLGAPQDVAEMALTTDFGIEDYLTMTPEQLKERVKSHKQDINERRLKETGYDEYVLKKAKEQYGEDIKSTDDMSWVREDLTTRRRRGIAGGKDGLTDEQFMTPEEYLKSKGRKYEITDREMVYKGARVDYDSGGAKIETESEKTQYRMQMAQYQQGLQEAFEKIDSSIDRVGGSVAKIIGQGFAEMAERISDEADDALKSASDVPGTKKGLSSTGTVGTQAVGLTAADFDSD